ncbi:MAG TPA: alpha-E domain-containing protein [Bryobacteraceae bacterium]|jgi:uncharacterized alpha-E superfamily protein|nr:alpha-E domain-containing protein [Bryobacteraceae bacterium]
MLSRVADSLYWMSRYLERAEHAARVLDVHLNLALDHSADSAKLRWHRILTCLLPGSVKAGPNETTSTIESLVFNTANRSSIVSCIMAARENARQVREQISSEMWEQLNRLYHDVRRASIEDVRDSQPTEFLTAVRERNYLFQGIADSTMNHGQGWHFIQLGRYIERACATATLLDVHFTDFTRSPDWDTPQGEHLEWVGLLRSCTAFEAYCKVYTAELRPSRIAEFLLLNEEFPHSVRFSVENIQRALNAISSTSPTRKADRPRKLAGRLAAALTFTQIDEVLAGGFHQTLENVQRQCQQVHGAVYQIYIAYPIQSALEA